MKHVKRILVALAVGLLMGVIVGLNNKFSGTEDWLIIAFYAGWFCAMGCWFGIGLDFFHRD